VTRAKTNGRSPAGRAPPHDLDAEAAVLSAILLSGDALDRVLDVLGPEHFFSDANGRIFEAARELARASKPVDIVSVASYLRDREKLAQVGGPAYIAELADATPAVAHVEAHAKVVHDLWRRRSVIIAAQIVAAEGYGDVGDVGAWVEEATARLGRCAAPTSARGPFAIDEDLFEQLPPRNFLIPSLNIGPGAPVGVFAYAWGGKTIIIQDLALSVMSGARVFGQFYTRGGAVTHVDYEQGKAETLERYQRLARARGIGPEAVVGRFKLASLPRTYLTTPGAEDAFKKLADGAALMIVDSAAAAQPGVAENETAFADGLYMLGRVSEATGATVIVIGHTGKADLAIEKPSNDARTAPRGTSAIVAACSTAFALTGGKGQPKRVTMIKGRSLGGALVEDFYLRLEPVRIDGYVNPEQPSDPGGFRVVYETDEQVNPPSSPEQEIAADVARVVATVKKCGANGAAGADYIAKLAGMNAARGRIAVRAAAASGRLVNIAKKTNGEPDERHPRYVAHDSSRHSSTLKGVDELDECEDSSRDELDELDEVTS
jgi:hypothetical protein